MTRTSLADLQRAAEAGAKAAAALLPRPTDRGAVQAFGTRMRSYLKRRRGRRAATPAPEPTSPLTRMLLEYEARLNVFCPTGDGGGIDPTCSPGGGGKGTPRGLVGRSVEQLPVSSISLGSKRAEVELEFDYSKGVRSTNPRKPILVDENNEVIDGAHRLVEARKRGEDTISAIRVTRAEHEALGDEALGIRPKGTEDIRKGKEFDEWMDKHYYMVGNVFCPTGPGGGVDPTCSPSEKLARLPEAGPNYFATMGLVRAWLRTPVANSPPPRKALADALYDISSEYTRAQAREVARTVREGYDNDKGVEKVAAELKRRLGLEDAQANVLAVTEMTRVAALDVLDQTRKAGSDEVMFISHEGSCPQCEALHGKVFPLKRAHDVLPVHPNCTCRFQPVGSTHNVFCPTGEGGGIDPSCSPTGQKTLKVVKETPYINQKYRVSEIEGAIRDSTIMGGSDEWPTSGKWAGFEPTGPGKKGRWPVLEVNPEKVYTTQDWTVKEKSAEITGTLRKDKPVLLVRHEGRLYIEDGNHRALHALKTDQKLPARVVEFGPDGTLNPVISL